MLRRLRADDLAAFQAYRHDPEVGRWQGWTPRPDAEALAFLNEMAAAPPFAPGGWTQVAVQRGVRSLEPEEITSCPRPEELPVNLPGKDAAAQGEGALRAQIFPEGFHQAHEARRGKGGIFAALEHEGTVSRSKSPPHRAPDLTFRKTVALGVGVPRPDAAVEAVLGAEV